MPINKDGLHLETHLPSNALANVENYPSSEQPSSRGLCDLSFSSLSSRSSCLPTFFAFEEHLAEL